MNKEKVRDLLKKFFTGRDLDKDIEKLYPLFDKKRLNSVLEGTADFNKADVVIIMSVAVELLPGNKMAIEKQYLDLITEIKQEIGAAGSIVGH